MDIDKVTISSQIRYILYQSQQTHGLRHKDYARYHGYCTRKLKRLRKFTKLSFGTQRKVVPITIEQILSNLQPNDPTGDRKFLIAIFEIERCWAAAMEYKQLETARGTHHGIQRLKKAVKYAVELEKYCESASLVDARTKLEISAYHSYIKGQLDIEMQKWAEAEKNLTTTRTIYSTLSNSVVGIKKSSYLSICDDLLPYLRLCAYNTGNKSILEELRKDAGHGDSSLDSKLKSLIEQSRGEESTRLEMINWKIDNFNEHEIVQIPIASNLKQVKISISAIKEFKQDLENEIATTNQIATKIELCDNSLSELREAIQCVRSDIHANATKNDKIEEESSNLLLNYLKFCKIEWLAERNLYLADDLFIKHLKKIEKPGDYARLFDLVVNQLNEMVNFAENLPKIKFYYDFLLQAFRSLRGYYLSIYETTVNNPNLRHALVLNRVAFDCGNNAAGLYNKIDKIAKQTLFKSLKCHLTSVLENAKNEEFQLRATITSKTAAVPEMVNPNYKFGTKANPLINDLENHFILNAKLDMKNLQILDFPPKMQPLSLKPVFFDLAENYLSFPEFDEYVVENKSGDGGKSSGWMSGWWGRK